MTDHWKVIEKAIEIARNQQQNVRDHYTDEILAELDAALAFVREQRTQAERSEYEVLPDGEYDMGSIEGNNASDRVRITHISDRYLLIVQDGEKKAGMYLPDNWFICRRVPTAPRAATAAHGRKGGGG